MIISIRDDVEINQSLVFLEKNEERHSLKAFIHQAMIR